MFQYKVYTRHGVTKDINVWEVTANSSVDAMAHVAAFDLYQIPFRVECIKDFKVMEGGYVNNVVYVDFKAKRRIVNHPSSSNTA
jgi:myo-inositol-hexaphosphate 3-phosphohydrolase